MHSVCSGEGHAQVLGSTFSPCAADQLEQRGRWLRGNVWPELSEERPLELRHQVSFLQDKTARSSAAVPAASTGQAESGALPACNGGEIRHGKVGQAGSYSAEAWDLPTGIPHRTGEPHFPAPRPTTPSSTTGVLMMRWGQCFTEPQYSRSW